MKCVSKMVIGWSTTDTQFGMVFDKNFFFFTDGQFNVSSFRGTTAVGSRRGARVFSLLWCQGFENQFRQNFCCWIVVDGKFDGGVVACFCIHFGTVDVPMGAVLGM